MSTFSFKFNDIVHTLEFSPYDWCSQLVGVGTSNHVVVATCKFQAEFAEIDGCEFEKLREFHHGTRVTCFAWSPETSLLIVPKTVRFCTGGGDKKLRLYYSDLKEEDHVEILDGHTSYINDIKYEPQRGASFASVSDDHTCRVWDGDGMQIAYFTLGSPGMSVCWHPEEPSKLMVAEKKGIIRFYNVQTQQPIMSLDCGNMPLLCSDWCPGNSLRVAASTLSEIFLFNTAESSHPEDSRQIHLNGSSVVRWSRSHSQLLASVGRPGPQLKVTNISTGQTLLCSNQAILHGVSWHLRLPIVAVAGDRAVHFWLLDSM